MASQEATTAGTGNGRRKRVSGELLKRTVTVTVVFGGVGWCLWGTGGTLLGFLVIAALTYLALQELYDLIEKRGILVWRLAGVLSSLLLVLCGYLNLIHRDGTYYLPGPLLILFFTTFVLQLRRGIAGSAASIMATYFGFLYVACPLASILWIRANPEGEAYIVILLLATACNDIGGYVIGKAFGRHPLTPVLSPKKTWEGAFGGLLFALIAIGIGGLLFQAFSDAGKFFFAPFRSAYSHAFALGILVCIFGTLGDLAESMLKREVGVKDSGGSTTGHGGFLDMVDSLLFTGPIVLLYSMWVEVV